MFRRNTIKRRQVLKNFQADTQIITAYPYRLNFYTVPPQDEVTLEEFELWAIDRLYGKRSVQEFCLWLIASSIRRDRIPFVQK